MGQSVVVVDAFTDRAFGGNPAAVCVMGSAADAGWMQRVAAEMNLSETAFLHPEGSGVWRLRWFTPRVEVDLCGHATLATSHVLWESGRLRADEPAVFETRSGRLTAARDGEWIVLDFPAEPPVDCPVSEDLAAAIGPGVVVARSARNRMDWLVELESESAVRAIKPDFGRLGKIAVRGLIATARSDDPAFDFVSRFFAPAVGIDEDPVCGSAHCALGPHWAGRLGKVDLMGHQISTRGGVLRVGVRGDRVRLGGRAVTSLRGELSEGADRPDA